MRRSLLAVLLLLLAAVGASGQSYTTVTSTVKDNSAAATPYALGTFNVVLVNTTGQQATFGGSPNFQQSYTGQSLSSTGFMSIVLPSVTAMSPAGLQWQFNICANPGQIAGVFPPVALPCFSYSSTGTLISGSTVDLSAQMKAVAATIPTVGSASSFPVTTPVTVNTGGSITATGTGVIIATNGITSVSSLPGSCTVGTSAPVQWVTASGINYGLFYARNVNGTCIWQPDNVPMGALSPLSYGALLDVRFVSDCVFNSTITVSCPNGDVTFTAADVGKIAFGTSGASSVNPPFSGTLSCPQTTIATFVSSSSITLNSACTANCTPSPSAVCYFAWGTQDDTTAINNTAAAAWSGVNNCYNVRLSGYFFFSAKLLAPTIGTACGNSNGSGNGAAADIISQGPYVYGDSPIATVAVPLPSFNFAGCNAGAGTTCIFGVVNGQSHDWSINGLQQSLPTTTHANVIFEGRGGAGCSGGSYVWNMGISGWGAQSTSLTGFLFGGNSCNDPALFNVNVQLAGSTPCLITPSSNILWASALMCFGGGFGGAPIMNVNGAGLFECDGCQIMGSLSNGGSILLLQGGGTSNFRGNVIASQFAGTNGCGNCQVIYMSGSTANANFDGSNIYISQSVSGTNRLFYLAGTGNIHVKNSILNAASGGSGFNQLLFTGAGNNFYDDGGNTFIQGAVANSITAGTYYQSYSVTGTTITAAKLVLSGGWGASAAWTALKGNTRYIEGTITNTGAGQAANPTITYTFPTPFIDVSSVACDAWQVGGTQAILAATEFLTPSALSTTGVTFTYNGTPTVNLTEVIHISCDSK